MIPVQGRVPSQWNEETAGILTRRLQAIERALGGSAQVFSTPVSPTFGAGSGQVASTAAGSAPVATQADHGQLAGLDDDDHYLYEYRDQPPQPHIHGEADVVGLDSRFMTRGEQNEPHAHRLADVADFGMLEMMLWREVFGG